MKTYKILQLNNDEQYACLIVICTADSPYNYLDVISKEIEKDKLTGKVLIDELLHVGNNSKRFLEFEIVDSGLSNERFVNVSKDSFYREKTCEFYRKSNLLDGSILSSIQKRMISKGIVI